MTISASLITSNIASPSATPRTCYIHSLLPVLAESPVRTCAGSDVVPVGATLPPVTLCCATVPSPPSIPFTALSTGVAETRSIPRSILRKQSSLPEMDDREGEPFANRDEAIPIVVINPDDEALAPADNEQRVRKRDAIKRGMSPSRLKEKLEEAGEKKAGSNSLQDRMFTM